MTWGWTDSTMFWWMAAGSLFWGVVVVAGIYLMTRTGEHDGESRSGAPAQKTEPSLHTPRHRFAEDEISDDELERVRAKLSR
jgi:uncharacterized membrane protein